MLDWLTSRADMVGKKTEGGKKRRVTPPVVRVGISNATAFLC